MQIALNSFNSTSQSTDSSRCPIYASLALNDGMTMLQQSGPSLILALRTAALLLIGCADDEWGGAGTSDTGREMDMPEDPTTRLLK